MKFFEVVFIYFALILFEGLYRFAYYYLELFHKVTDFKDTQIDIIIVMILYLVYRDLKHHEKK